MGEGTSQPTGSLPLPFRSPQRGVGGRQPRGPLEEIACCRSGAVTLEGWQLFPLHSRELEEGESLSVSPSLPLPTNRSLCVMGEEPHTHVGPKEVTMSSKMESSLA